jgi:Na+/H+ antiporter NhaA
MLAFNDPEHVLTSKTTILVSSLTAGILGYAILHAVLPAPKGTAIRGGPGPTV